MITECERDKLGREWWWWCTGGGRWVVADGGSGEELRVVAKGGSELV